MRSMEDIEELKDEIESLRFEIDSMRKEIKNITPHKHCLNCGISIPPDQTFCSKKCENEWNRILKRKKTMMYVWVLFLVILFIILIASGL